MKQILAFALVLGFAANARADRDGFFARFNLGPSISNSSIGDGNSDIEVSGVGGSASLLLGGSISPNTALHGTFYGHTIVEPDVSFGAFETENLEDTSWGVQGFGLGLQHYLPGDLYLGGSLMVMNVSVEFGDRGSTLTFESEAGLGLMANFGTEWALSNEFAFGLNAEVVAASVGDDDIDDQWIVLIGGVNACLTYW
ncbi:MAG: hypothetical protein AAF654_02890 [Myxococcota bacterium]